MYVEQGSQQHYYGGGRKRSSDTEMESTNARGGGETNGEQISDYLTDSERNEHWPTMWRNRIWRTEQWKQEDERKRHPLSMSVKQEQEQRREIIRRAKEHQEREIEEGEEEQWEEAVRQVLEEAEGLTGQKQEKMQCKT